jgi:hypothetical protein
MATEIATQVRQDILIPRNITEAMELAKFISGAMLVPDHLRGKPADCLLIVEQAARWGMSPLAVAQGTSIVHGKLCYEGKVVAAALESLNAIDGRLEYDFSGAAEARSITVSGKPRGGSKVQSITGTVAGWKTTGGNWQKDPDSMLVYRGTRQWARLYTPGALLGVYTPDEFEEAPAVATIITQSSVPGAAPVREAPRNAKEAVEATIVPSEGRDRLIAQLEGAAAQGKDALLTVWQSLTDAQRDEIGPDFGRIKKMVPK